MAVARISAPAGWFVRTAELVEDLPLARRELLRAAERRGLMAELDANEVRALAERLPEDERVQEALVDLERAEEHERTRWYPHPRRA